MKLGKFYITPGCNLSSEKGESFVGYDIIYDHQTGPDNFNVNGLGMYRIEEIRQLHHELVKIIDSVDAESLKNRYTDDGWQENENGNPS